MSDNKLQKTIAEIIEIGKRLWTRGMVAANDGNISCRCQEGFLITRSGVSKGFLEQKDILIINDEGQPLSANAPLPSIETALHLAVYRNNPQAAAIIHAHPPYATAFALSSLNINTFPLEELRLQLDEVPLIPYAPAGSPQLAELVGNYMQAARAGLMERHGALSVGASLMEALFRMEALEQAAKIISISKNLSAD